MIIENTFIQFLLTIIMYRENDPLRGGIYSKYLKEFKCLRRCLFEFYEMTVDSCFTNINSHIIET